MRDDTKAAASEIKGIIAMRYTKSLAACLLASAALMQPALAADTMAPGSMKESAPQKKVDMDFAKLSKDGAQAFRDMHLARLAIFDAEPSKAKSEINAAKAALDKAKTDDTVFMKAESDLKPPTSGSTDKSNMQGKTTAATAAATPSASSTPSSEKVAWLPIDAQLSLGENFVATPDKAGAVSEANKHIQAGDKKAAVDRLKLAGIDVDMTLAVLPLDQTITDVGNAANLIEQGKYYEANATLKQVEDRIRFDVVDTTTMPKNPSATPTAPMAPAPSAPAAPIAPAPSAPAKSN